MDKSITLPSFSARLLKLAKTIESERNEFLSSKNLMPGHDAFLLALKLNDGITMGALAEQLEITASSATKIATKMETLNLVRREASRIDSRQNHAFLTETGVKLADEITEAYNKLDAELKAKAKSKDIERGFKLFDRLETDPSSAAKTPKKAGGKKNKSKKTSEKKPKKQKKSKSDNSPD